MLTYKTIIIDACNKYSLVYFYDNINNTFVNWNKYRSQMVKSIIKTDEGIKNNACKKEKI